MRADSYNTATTAPTSRELLDTAGHTSQSKHFRIVRRPLSKHTNFRYCNHGNTHLFIFWSFQYIQKSINAYFNSQESALWDDKFIRIVLLDDKVQGSEWSEKLRREIICGSQKKVRVTEIK